MQVGPEKLERLNTYKLKLASLIVPWLRATNFNMSMQIFGVCLLTNLFFYNKTRSYIIWYEVYKVT